MAKIKLSFKFKPNDPHTVAIDTWLFKPNVYATVQEATKVIATHPVLEKYRSVVILRYK